MDISFQRTLDSVAVIKTEENKTKKAILSIPMSPPPNSIVPGP